MNRLEQARAVVRQAQLPDTLRRLGEGDIGHYAVENARLTYYNGSHTGFLTTEVTPDVLAESLQYAIKLGRHPIGDESSVPLGASKYRGLPHLPASVTWPAGMYFGAQFNLRELHPLDIHDAFPAEGILYIFFGSAEDLAVIHYDGPLDVLRVTPYPDAATIPDAEYYLDDFIEQAALIRFEPRGIFYLDGDAYDLSAAPRLLPQDLKDQISRVLGAPVVTRDTDRRIFGRPIYWQGEDEGYGFLDDEDREDDGIGFPVTRRPDERHLLFQDELEDTTIHVWIAQADAAKRDYSKCWMDSSGT